MQLGSPASKAELRWLSRLELWPFTSGVIILVLIQWLLQMHMQELVPLQGPAGHNTEWLSQFGWIHRQVFLRKASPRSLLTTRSQKFGWEHYQNVVVYLKTCKILFFRKGTQTGRVEAGWEVGLWGSVSYVLQFSFQSYAINHSNNVINS